MRRSETSEQQEHERQIHMQHYPDGSENLETNPSSFVAPPGQVIDEYGSSREGSVRGKVKGFWQDVVKPEFSMIKSAMSIEEIVKRDIQDPSKYPEISQTAEVRRGIELCVEEREYLSDRRWKIKDFFAKYVGLDPCEVHPDDVPIVAFGGSGGGYRAMIGFLAYSDGMKQFGLWDTLTYAAGVSGSCWAIAAYYTIGEASMKKVIDHCKKRLSPHHPLSPDAIRILLNSPEGPYSTLGPLVQKKASGLENVAMDLYSLFTTNYLFLNDPMLIPGGPNKASLAEVAGHHPNWYKWSKAMKYLNGGAEPLPILTAIRHERPWKDWESEKCPFKPCDSTAEQHASARNAWFQWFEMTPFEVGCDELSAWVPIWGFGRPFRGGRSVMQLPEQSLALLLGLCTSAPAGPLTSYLATIKRSLPAGFIADAIHDISHRIANMWGAEKKEEFQQHHPLHACDEHNPLFHYTYADKNGDRPAGIERSPRIQLIDSGMDNNCPTYVMLHPSREVDVIINMDASSDVLKDTFQERVDQIGSRRGLKFTKRHPNIKAGSNARDPNRFDGCYAQIYDGTVCPRPDTIVDSYGHTVQNPPAPISHHECSMLYLPLLPNEREVPGFDPSTAKFSGSYNLVWTAEQVETLVKVCIANLRDGENTVRNVLRESYEKKKKKRIQREAQKDGAPEVFAPTR
ncbi:putative cytosolic phospholipase A2 [Microthyrium microscopicum]|uniref:Lysophospholipase n=1 Tax=Microthyrium microscopicum TaxID=703497 RepID=A0A6A6U886_9PEZI|nr:putative cytosolic phospholipase A2 [Microthyrium microscopicum]